MAESTAIVRSESPTDVVRVLSPMSPSEYFQAIDDVYDASPTTRRIVIRCSSGLWGRSESWEIWQHGALHSLSTTREQFQSRLNTLGWKIDEPVG